MEVILDPAKVARNYVQTWLILDLLGAVPADIVWFAGAPAQTVFWLRILRLPVVVYAADAQRVVRLLRLPQLGHRANMFADHLKFGVAIRRTLWLLFALAIFLHWGACVVNRMNDMAMLDLAEVTGPNSRFNNYLVSGFHVFSMFFTHGYGHQIPGGEDLGELWITWFAVLIGGGFYALMIANLATILVRFNSLQSIFQTKLEAFEAYMASQNLPEDLRARVRQQLANNMRRRQLIRENVLLEELSHSLRLDIYLFLCSDLFRHIPFLRDGNRGLWATMAQYLIPETFMPGDVVCVVDQIATCMYFVLSGRLECLTSAGKVARVLGEGSHFGETALFTGGRRTLTVRAATVVDVMMLPEEHFHLLVDKFPTMHSELLKVAKLRSRRTSDPKSPLVTTPKPASAHTFSDESVRAWHSHANSVGVVKECHECEADEEGERLPDPAAFNVSTPIDDASPKPRMTFSPHQSSPASPAVLSLPPPSLENSPLPQERKTVPTVTTTFPENGATTLPEQSRS